MKLQLSRMHTGVTTLGWGTRIGIWVQGCSIGCEGCIAIDTWKKDPSKGIEVSALLARIAQEDIAQVDGVTISGGEPFEQPEALSELLDGLDRWRSTADHDIDLLGYSGMRETTLRESYWEIATKLDVLIAEPFQLELLGTSALRGSENQRLLTLTELGTRRYSGDDNLRDLASQRDVVGLRVDSEVWGVNIPSRPGARELARDVRDQVRLRRSAE